MVVVKRCTAYLIYMLEHPRRGHGAVRAPQMEEKDMTNSIRTISMPAGSDADRILSEWANDGRNVSEMTRQAVEGWVRVDAMQRRILAFGWCLAQRGVCPVLLEKPDKREAVHHSCDACEDFLDKWGGLDPHTLSAEGRRTVVWRQETLASMIDAWRVMYNA
jgi:hypothetical protein